MQGKSYFFYFNMGKHSNFSTNFLISSFLVVLEQSEPLLPRTGLANKSESLDFK